MAMHPPVRSSVLVLFVSCSTFMTALLGVALLAACAGNPDPADSEIEPVPNEPSVVAVIAVEPLEKKADEWDGVEEVVVEGEATEALLTATTSVVAFDSANLETAGASEPLHRRMLATLGYVGAGQTIALAPVIDWNTERYDEISEGGFLRPGDSPLSTFSIDVDTASYANVRRFLKDRTRPPEGAVRIEELVNYFRYPSQTQVGDEPFSVDLEIFNAPWRAEHRLVRIAVEGREMPRSEVPPRNLVFLLDVSGSMQGPDRLGLVKYGLSRLTESLRPIDRVSIVVYAGASGVVLPPTAGDDENTIVEALDRLHAGGSTAGAEGIRLAYATAREHFNPDGINRIILATDGDFNVGVSNRSDLIALIEKERESGVFLTVLGVGRGNLNDAAMEQIADHGNGNYAYIDGRSEARKVLVEQADSTLITIAKDVKIQVEFNPRRVKAYRLIGYENRRLADQDFNDDTKDAGEIGAGHHVTALYEIVPTDSQGGVAGASVDPLKYQEQSDLTAAADSGEWLNVKLRYKAPDGEESQLVSAALAGQPGSIRTASENARFSTAVALFGMLLRDSEFKGAGSYTLVADLARNAVGRDEYGERKEFLELVDLAQKI
jgi:Ca-activated chloride channel family protein